MDSKIEYEGSSGHKKCQITLREGRRSDAVEKIKKAMGRMSRTKTSSMRIRRIGPDPRIAAAWREVVELRREQEDLMRVIWEQQDQMNVARENERSWRAVAEA